MATVGKIIFRMYSDKSASLLHKQNVTGSYPNITVEWRKQMSLEKPSSKNIFKTRIGKLMTHWGQHLFWKDKFSATDAAAIIRVTAGSLFATWPFCQTNVCAQWFKAIVRPSVVHRLDLQLYFSPLLQTLKDSKGLIPTFLKSKQNFYRCYHIGRRQNCLDCEVPFAFGSNVGSPSNFLNLNMKELFQGSWGFWEFLTNYMQALFNMLRQLVA